MTTTNCPYCGAEIDSDAQRCYVCKKWLTDKTNILEDKPQEFLPTVLFAYFLGVFGIHRFFTESIAIGVAQLLTFGGCGIWAYIDFILICFNKYRDGQGRLLSKYNPNIGITVFVISLIPLVLILLMIFIMTLAILAASAK